MEKITNPLGFIVKNTLLAAAFILGAIAVPAVVHAQSTETYSANWGPDAIPSAPSLVSLAQFDTSLGTLDSFSLELVANTDAGQITYTDTSGLPTDVEVLAVGATVTATAPSGVTLAAVPRQAGSDPDLAAYASYTVIGNSGTASDTFGPDSNPLDFGPYEGTGDFNVNISAVLYQQLFTSGGTGTLTSSSEETDGTVSVTYNFTPVPEPSAIALLGCGLSVLPFLRRRRQ